MKKFATLTIGQAPRPDLAPVFNLYRSHLGRSENH